MISLRSIMHGKAHWSSRLRSLLLFPVSPAPLGRDCSKPRRTDATTGRPRPPIPPRAAQSSPLGRLSPIARTPADHAATDPLSPPSVAAKTSRPSWQHREGGNA